MASINKYQLQAAGDAPVIFNDLEFHPLLVREYTIYARAKRAMELMQSSLHPKYAKFTWCECLWELDKECEKQTGQYGDFLVSVMLAVARALRLEAPDGDVTLPLRPVFSQDGHLTALMIGEAYGNYTLLNMQQMNEVRLILAAQNGYDIPDENWNPELVRAAQQNAEGNNAGLDIDFDALLYSVALNAHCRAKDILDWSIREFHGMQDAIDRTLGYQIYTLAEMSGFVEFKKGNPYPTWKFNRKSDMPTGFKSIAELDAGAKGLVAGT